MKIYDYKASDGSLLAFEIDNATLTRNRTCHIAASIPGAKVIKRSRLFRDSDDFCEFMLDGESFIIEEPFGDNSRYWIGPKGSVPSNSLAIVREAFEQYASWHAGRFILIALALGIAILLGHRCSIFLAQDSCLDEGGSWDRIQQIFSKDTQK